MELYGLKAHELKELLKKGEVKSEEIVKSHLDRIDQVEDKVGAFLYVDREESLKSARAFDEKKAQDTLLGGIPVGIKDNISVKGMQNTCASKFLEGYIAPYDATVTTRLKEEGAVILGKLNMDEFAMGSSTEYSAYKLTRNPHDLERVPGGSSGGSAASVAALEVPLSLGTDTGGSVRQPASFCGILGLKPTYGNISRYGVTAFGSTLDQVGTFARDVKDLALLTTAVSGYDKMDFTTNHRETPNLFEGLNKDIRGKKIAIAKDFLGEGLDEHVRKNLMETIEVLKDLGASVDFIDLNLASYALAVYYIVSSAEASSNLARFDGVRYGRRAEDLEDVMDLYAKSRSEGFGPEVKRRIMLGTYVLSAGYYDAYYAKALKVRKLIQEEYSSIFRTYDAIISPTTPTPAFKIGDNKEDILQMYLNDIYTVPVNIAGIPALSMPSGTSNGLPLGLQIMGDYFKEQDILNIAYAVESALSLSLSPKML